MFNRFTVAALACMLAGSLLVAQDKPHPKPAGKPAEASAKAEGFVIAKVGDKMEVLAKGEVEAKKKKFADDFKAAKEQWEKDKKAAEDAKKKFETPAPKETTVEVKPGEFPTKDAAEAAAKKMEGEKEKGGEHGEKGGDKGHKPEGGKKPAGGGKK